MTKELLKRGHQKPLLRFWWLRVQGFNGVRRGMTSIRFFHLLGRQTGGRPFRLSIKNKNTGGGGGDLTSVWHLIEKDKEWTQQIRVVEQKTDEVVLSPVFFFVAPYWPRPFTKTCRRLTKTWPRFVQEQRPGFYKNKCCCCCCCRCCLNPVFSVCCNRPRPQHGHVIRFTPI